MRSFCSVFSGSWRLGNGKVADVAVKVLGRPLPYLGFTTAWDVQISGYAMQRTLPNKLSEHHGPLAEHSPRFGAAALGFSSCAGITDAASAAGDWAQKHDSGAGGDDAVAGGNHGAASRAP